MGPEKWKGEVPVREAAEQEDEKSATRRVPDQEVQPARIASEDAREEEGWGQPESSAQKLPEK